MDNCEEFGELTKADIRHFVSIVQDLYDNTDYGIYITIPGVAFGDIALVPATWMKDPKGIRDVTEWYVSTAIRQDYIHKVFERQCEIGLRNVEILAGALGDMVQVAFVSGTDFGTQNGLFASPETFRQLYKPYIKAINDRIHELTGWKTFMHCCGGIAEIIPDIIEAGIDVLNPVQYYAATMDPERIKKEFGRDLVFWGGGVNTQKTLPFTAPDDVYREVMRQIEIFHSDNTGFVFNAVHNIQSDVPTENFMAMFRALNDVRAL
jgi:uroporphyrinogen-III decarboxylase